MSRLERVLFPDPPRELRGERAIRTTLRTAHLACMAILLGGHFFDVDAARLWVWLWLTVASGGLFAALELYASFTWLFQVRGLLFLLKIALLCLVPFLWEHRLWLLLAVLAIGAIASHLPSQFRCHSLLFRNFPCADRRG
jgi:hypothetical protein